MPFAWTPEPTRRRTTRATSSSTRRTCCSASWLATGRISRPTPVPSPESRRIRASTARTSTSLRTSVSLFHERHAPGLGAGFDAPRLLQFGDVDHRDIVAGTVGDVERSPVGGDGDAPWTLA